MRILVTITVFLLLVSAAAYAGNWEKFTSPDSAFSFHYPAGWSVKTENTMIEISNPSADEQLLIVSVPYKEDKSPIELAKDIVALFKASLPDIKAADWHSDPGSESKSVSFSIKYTDKSKNYAGNVVVVKNEGQATWFSFSGLTSSYSQGRALKILGGEIMSVAPGADSKPPTFDVPEIDTAPRPTAQELQKNADAFVFVLEFSLGAPLSAGDEKIIQAELRNAWALSSASELKQFGDYPNLIKSILSANEDQLNQVHTALQTSVKEWLDTANDSDPTAKIIRNQFEQNGKILAEDSPGLSELAAESYSEMIAFAEMLYTNPKSTLDQIPQAKLATIKKKLVSSWAGFSEQDRSLVVSTPAVWITVRQLLKFGSTEEQTKMRTTVRGLWVPAVEKAKTASAASAKAGSSTANKKKSTWDPVSSNIMNNMRMQSQQNTFNSYMWSRGYSGWTPMGKSW